MKAPAGFRPVGLVQIVDHHKHCVAVLGHMTGIDRYPHDVLMYEVPAQVIGGLRLGVESRPDQVAREGASLCLRGDATVSVVDYDD